jgi:hypothetical protein
MLDAIVNTRDGIQRVGTDKAKSSAPRGRRQRPEYDFNLPSGVSYHTLIFLSPSCPIANTTTRHQHQSHTTPLGLTFPLLSIHTLHERLAGDQPAPTAAPAAGFDGSGGSVVRREVL